VQVLNIYYHRWINAPPIGSEKRYLPVIVTYSQ